MRLTETQYEVLDSLRLFKTWNRRFCMNGWVWDTPSNTERIMESLFKKNLVSKVKGTYRVMKGIDFSVMKKRLGESNGKSKESTY